MQKVNIFFMMSILLFQIGCSQNASNNKAKNVAGVPKSILTESYELLLPEKQNGFLILFPCFPCNAAHTKTEFNILETATKNNVAVLLMNFNLHLWLSENEKQALESKIIEAVEANKINTNNTFIGGFSSGGNVSLLLTDYLKSKASPLQPKGVFIVDSPIDLLGLYGDAQKSIEKNYSEIAIQEGKRIVELFDAEFGVGDTSLINYMRKSPYISKTNSLVNLSNLKDLKIRFYSEPDTIWWKENRQVDYEDTNAYSIKLLSEALKQLYGDNSVEYIETKDKGYRSDGERHPHSWSIVDEESLINWVLKK